MTKDELQGMAAKQLAKCKRYVCQWATGCGKTRVALLFLEEHPGMQCLIVVPEQDNINNWHDEFKKFNVDESNVMIICYASLHKYKDTSWGLLVLDEAPHADTQKRKQILRTMNAEYVLALGAVVDMEEMDSLESVYGPFKKWRVTLDMAIAWGILPGPTITICHLELDDKMPKVWYKGKAYTEKKYYTILENKVSSAVDVYNRNASELNKRKMLSYGNERKRFLGECKQNAAKLLCEELEKNNKRFLCFCSSIKQAQALGGDRAYTSQSKKSMAHLDKFNNHEINSLYVVGKLIEGQNLKDIECGVIVQLGGTERITVQSIGRIMRSDNPVIYVPVFDGTKDDSFLYTLTDNIPDNCIKHYKF